MYQHTSLNRKTYFSSVQSNLYKKYQSKIISLRYVKVKDVTILPYSEIQILYKCNLDLPLKK